ncbi:UDP-N-acetylglucosamine 2-epimerase (non-hydrolyzing) [Puteibacter caeruleilacunae]|nr:UDP-N-acetylglucosamine 2-epimerase (non-hydrolyzing) [Puteibacter caeruleilacunae]
MTSVKKIMLVFGTRPEAIKMAPLVKKFQSKSDNFKTIVCVTAQHREMLDQVLDLFNITPDYDLNLMKQGQDLYDITSRVLLGMRNVLAGAKPDIVLVHGDTTTSTATALAAFYQQIPVGHVEAGLRTHNLYSPWPEEANRQITGRLTEYHFAPTSLSKTNLIAENISENKITVTGNTVIDALHMVLEQIKNSNNLKTEISNKLEACGLANGVIEQYVSLTNPSRKMVLITGHRRENFGQGFINICRAIKTLAEQNPSVDFIYPMHLNPNVRKAIAEVFGQDVLKKSDSPHVITNAHFIEPLEYLPFVHMMSKSYLILTDSGGIQEEAPGLGKPVLVMRDTTERPEALEAGTVKLVGTNYQKIVDEVNLLIRNEEAYHSMSAAVNPYGDGLACERIIDKLLSE